MTPSTPPRGLVIAAPGSGQGKTVVTLGLIRALTDRGLTVAPAKSGPDYLDPGFHAAAAGRACATLDAWAADGPQLRARAAAAAAGADLLVVEGAMGLYDGAADGTPAGRGSAADLAAALGLPVVLVLDISGMGQGAAAVVAGLARYRADVTVAGVILNRSGSPRHTALVAAAIGPVCPVLGAVPRDGDMALPARHLGLVQAGEHADLAPRITAIAARVAAGVDLDALAALARPLRPGGPPRRLAPLGQRIALARDAAFGFAYAHLIGDWHAAGAEVVPFSPLDDQAPDPGAAAVVLPGGYPELWAGRLAAAARFRSGMQAAAARGAWIYGECGGYMVLGRGLVTADGTRHAMLGLLDLDTSLAPPTRHLGYRRLTARGGPWAGRFAAHEFHYARTCRAEGPPMFAATDAAGAELGPMGLVQGRVAGSFAHLIEPI